MPTALESPPPVMTQAGPSPLGWWVGEGGSPISDVEAVRNAIHDIRQPLALLRTPAGLALPDGGICQLGGPRPDDALPIAAYALACRPEQLCDPAFLSDHGLRFGYVAGAIANGIGSREILEEMGRAGMLGLFRAPRLMPERRGKSTDP